MSYLVIVPLLSLLIFCLALVMAFDIFWRTSGQLKMGSTCIIGLLVFRCLSEVVHAMSARQAIFWDVFGTTADVLSALCTIAFVFILFRIISKFSS